MAKLSTPATTISAERLQESLLVDDLSFLLARANALSLAAGNAALQEFDLKVRSFAVLSLAVGEGRPSQRELAEFLQLDPSQIVALVDELQARGLVRREPDPNDRRANVVVSTDEGVALWRRASVSARESERQLHHALTAADREHLGALLRAMAFPA